MLYLWKLGFYVHVLDFGSLLGGFYDFPFFLSFSKVFGQLFGERDRWVLKFVLFSCTSMLLAFCNGITVEIKIENRIWSGLVWSYLVFISVFVVCGIWIFCTIRGAWFSLLICIMKFMLCPFCWWEVKDYSRACLLFVGRCSVARRWLRLWCLRCVKRWLWGFQCISMKVILWILCLFLCSLLSLFLNFLVPFCRNCFTRLVMVFCIILVFFD